VDQEAREKFSNAGLADAGQQIRQFEQRGIAGRKSTERALHAESHLLEAIEGQVLERLARRVPRLGLLAPENVDQQIYRAWPFQIAEERRQPHEPKRGLIFIGESKGFADGPVDGVDQRTRIAVRELDMNRSRSSLRSEEFGQKTRHVGRDGGHGRRFSRMGRAVQRCAPRARIVPCHDSPPLRPLPSSR